MTSGRSSLLVLLAGAITGTRLMCCMCAASASCLLILLLLCLPTLPVRATLPAPSACACKTLRSKLLYLLQQAYQVLRQGGVKEDNIVVMVSP